MATFSPSLDRALAVSAIVHRSQYRKGTLVPYVIHPFQVAMILERHGFDGRLVEAAVLHDVLEDMRPEDPDLQHSLRRTFPEAMGDAPEGPAGFKARFIEFLVSEFGAEVVSLVEAVSERKMSVDGRPIPWAERKETALEELARPDLPSDVLALKGADATHNVLSLERDLKLHGLHTLDRFRGTPAESLRYYGRVAGLVARRLGGRHLLAVELGDAVRALAHALLAAYGASHDTILDAVREVTTGAGE